MVYKMETIEVKKKIQNHIIAGSKARAVKWYLKKQMLMKINEYKGGWAHHLYKKKKSFLILLITSIIINKITRFMTMFQCLLLIKLLKKLVFFFMILYYLYN
jgi:hypothetical protein